MNKVVDARVLVAGVLSLGLILSQACGEHVGGPATGTEGGPCYPDSTCDEGLECLSDLCVTVSPCESGWTRPCTCQTASTGTQTCDPDGVWGECECGPVCGDGQASGGEECDGSDLAGQSCESLGYPGGTLGCTGQCTFDTSACQEPVLCGNGIVELPEQCDATDFGGQTCLTATGHRDGELQCLARCLLDISGCHTCGDTDIDGPEVCDGNNLAAKNCLTHAGHQDGALGCTADCLAFDTSGCHTCGNATIEGLEECEGAQLGGATCVSAGHSGGTLACGGDCHFDRNGCFDCGDGVCETAKGEDGANCPQDCTWTAISAGLHQSCALRGDGTAWCWGYNRNGQLGDGTTANRHAPVQVLGLSDVVSISAGPFQSTCAAKGDGTAWCWGYNGSGQLGDGTTTTYRVAPVQVSGLSDVVSISPGDGFTCAAKADGTAWCWGSNTSGQLGDGQQHQMCGSSPFEYDCSPTPVQVSGLSGVVSISVGSRHVCAAEGDGTAWCWGHNDYGKLGDGSTTDRDTPVQVSGLSGVVSISAGGYQTCAAKGDGTAWCWGHNDYGQLGDGSTTDRLTPVQVSGLSDVVWLSAGYYHSCAVKADGTAWCWGANYHGGLGDGQQHQMCGSSTFQFDCSLTPVRVAGP